MYAHCQPVKGRLSGPPSGSHVFVICTSEFEPSHALLYTYSLLHGGEVKTEGSRQLLLDG